MCRLDKFMGIAVTTALLAISAVSAEVFASDVSIPPDPVAPSSDQECLDLHAQYRALIDQQSAQADACQAKRPVYVQGRYSHDFGEGECARHLIEKCRVYVDQCTALSRAMMPALKRCRAALPE